MLVALIHYTGPPVAGGVEGTIDRQARLMADHGYDVLVLGGRGGAGRSGTNFRRVPLLAATHPRQRSMAARLADGTVPRHFEATAREIESALADALRGVDVIIAHNALTLHFNLPLTQALTNMAAGRWDGRIVGWTHDVAACNPLYQSELHEGMPWELLRQPIPGIRYVTISETRRVELEEVWQHAGVRQVPSVKVIPNGIDPIDAFRISEPLESLLSRARIFDRWPVLLAPVRITRRKNLERAIRVTRELRGRGLDPLLLVTGPVRGHHPAKSRQYLRELCKIASDIGVSDHVVFLAELLGRPLTQAEVLTLYSAASALVMPSESEGFGLPILEAGIQRLPIVASDLPVFREIAGNEASYFNADSNDAAVADLVLRATQRDELRQRLLREFSWESLFEARYQPLLAGMGSDG